MKTLGSFWVEFEVVNTAEISYNECRKIKSANNLKSEENEG